MFCILYLPNHPACKEKNVHSQLYLLVIKQLAIKHVRPNFKKMLQETYTENNGHSLRVCSFR